MNEITETDTPDEVSPEAAPEAKVETRADAEVEADLDGEADVDGEGDQAEAKPKKSGGRSSGTKKLDAEGDYAADFLEELLDILDMDGDIDISVEAGRAKVAVVSSDGPSADMKRLVGPDGEVLEALQDLARLAVQVETGEMSRMMLDIAEFRAGRKERLAELGRETAAKVKADGESISLEPMNAFERKVVHDVILEAGLVSESEGEDPFRYVVVRPA